MSMQQGWSIPSSGRLRGRLDGHVDALIKIRIEGVVVVQRLVLHLDCAHCAHRCNRIQIECERIRSRWYAVDHPRYTLEGCGSSCRGKSEYDRSMFIFDGYIDKATLFFIFIVNYSSDIKSFFLPIGNLDALPVSLKPPQGGWGFVISSKPRDSGLVTKKCASDWWIDSKNNNTTIDEEKTAFMVEREQRRYVSVCVAEKNNKIK